MPWIICAALLVLVIVLLVKLRSQRRSLLDRERKISDIRAELEKSKSDSREMKEAVTNASHDLRTPLTAMYGYLDLLENSESKEDRDRYISRIRERCERMKEMTDELFDYSRTLSALKLSKSDENVAAILESTLLSFYGRFAGRGIEPNITLPDKPVRRYVDSNAVERIYGNIIDNALKYGDGDFTVEMTEDAAVSFKNHAKGLSSVEVGRLFDRFFTVDKKGRGGVGLSVAKRLTEEMGGSISAKIKDGVLTVTVKF